MKKKYNIYQLGRYLLRLPFFTKINAGEDVKSLINEGDYKKSVKILVELIKENKTNENYYRLALSYYFLHKYTSAFKAIENALLIQPDSIPSLLLKSQILSALHELDKADKVIRDVFFREPSRDAFNVLLEIYIKQEKKEELDSIANEFTLKQPLAGINLRHHSKFTLANRAIGLPPVLFCSMPKSGSIYISTRLADALKMPIVAITSAYKSRLVPSWIESFALGGVLAQEHLHPNPKNLELMKSYGVNKFIVHFRDPRSSALSMLHHHDKLYSRNDHMRFAAEKKLGKKHFRSSLHTKIDNILSTIFLQYSDWLEAWLVVAEQKNTGINILFTNYEQLQNEHELFESILTFYDIPISNAKFLEPDLRSNAHHRKGSIDEWRTVMSPAQQEFAWKRIRNLALKFGWRA